MNIRLEVGNDGDADGMSGLLDVSFNGAMPLVCIAAIDSGDGVIKRCSRPVHEGELWQFCVAILAAIGRAAEHSDKAR